MALIVWVLGEKFWKRKNMLSKTDSIRHILSIILLCLMSVFLLAGCDTITAVTPLPSGATIAEIQGAVHISPAMGQRVTNVHGIVTVVQSDGFYFQSAIPDDDPATSEGIFVFTELVPGVKPGDELLISAIVEEWVPGGFETGNLSITQLKTPVIEVLSTGNSLPTPTIIGEGGRMPPTVIIDDDTFGFVSDGSFFDPQSDGLDFYESLEGMLVQVNDAVVVGATSVFKEIVVLGDQGKNASVRTHRGGIVIRENDFNPERIIIDDALLAIPFVQTGDIAIQPIIGVLDYSFGNYKIKVTDEVLFRSGGLMPDSPLQPVGQGQLRVASYNLANLSAQDHQRIAVLADQIVNQLASPDIIGLQEIMDDDGGIKSATTSADRAYQQIIDAIENLGGPPYAFANIDPLVDQDGGVPGGNIQVGFLYRLDTGLSFIDAPQGDATTAVKILENEGQWMLSMNPGRISPTHLAFTNSRKPLAIAFHYQGKMLFLVNNHFIAKGGDRPLFGDMQPPLLASEYQRLQQAQIVHNFADQLLEADADSWVIVLGDLNDFQFSEPVRALGGEILINLIDTLPVERQYTYVYEGNSQVLDHILVSEGLWDRVDDFMILHINSEFDYLRRFSDHDVVIATFDFN